MNRKFWTTEEIAILRERYPNEFTADLAKDMGRTLRSLYAAANIYGVRKTIDHLNDPRCHGLDGTIGEANRFRKGHQPWNKGKKIGSHPGSVATQFKKGQTSINEMPIGSFCRTTKERHWCRKVQMTGLQRERWIPLHKLIWIENHGPIPPKHVVRFKNGNPGDKPEDIVIESLECISMAENCRRNSIHNLPKSVVDVIQQRGRLTREINKQRRAHEEQHRRLA